MRKEILFLLPGRATTPVGGYKVAFEYANRLARDGHRVTLVYPSMIPLASPSPWKSVRGFVRFFAILIRRDYRCSSWFRLERGVREKWVYRLRDGLFPRDAIAFATACETAYFLQRDSLLHLDRYYLIQHYEDWVDRKVLDSTWRSSLKKIVIADWLSEKAREYGVDCALIENGLDFGTFSVTVPIEDKDRESVTMLWHKAENKGSIDGLNALLEVKKEIPNLHASFFGIPKRPDFLPDWIRYYQRPTQTELREIYNRSAVFVAPSRSEGFGLTAAEAMQCGCAVAATDAGGFLQFCKDRITAYVSPAADTASLARSIVSLLKDDRERVRIATSGTEFIRKFTWERAYQKLCDIIGGGE